MKNLTLSVLILLILGCTIHKQPSKVLEKTLDKTVFIECYIDSLPFPIASGTGVVTDKGKITTCYHIISEADSIVITYNTFEKFTAKLNKTFEKHDLALLETEENQIKGIKISKFSDLKLGQDVYAIGNPINLRNSISQGIISNTDRYSNHLRTDVIQTDLHVNTGSSGGPLVNSKGELVGIVSMFIPTTGYSFSINSEKIKRFIK